MQRAVRMGGQAVRCCLGASLGAARLLFISLMVHMQTDDKIQSLRIDFRLSGS